MNECFLWMNVFYEWISFFESINDLINELLGQNYFFVEKMHDFDVLMNALPTDQPTNRLTNRPTNRRSKFRKYEGKLPLGVGLIPLPVTTFGLWEENAAANLLEIVNIQSNNLRGDKKNNKRHFFERLSVTLQRENGSMLLERCPLPAADVDGEL